MASLRAYCRSPISALISEAMRFEVVTYLKEGVPIAAMMPTTSMTTTSSVKLNPDIRSIPALLSMARHLREANLLETVCDVSGDQNETGVTKCALQNGAKLSCPA